MTDIPELSGPTRDPASGKAARQLVIFLHGYGADGNDLIELGRVFSQVLPDAAFVSPNAPDRCEGNPFGYQWFDVWMQDPVQRLKSIRRAAAAIDGYITGELDRLGLTEKDLVLVGFSQGTMMSLFVAPRREQPIAGIVGYSGRIESPDLLAEEIRSRPPVVLVHGDSDELLPASEMDRAAAALKGCGIAVATHLRRGLGHGIDEDGLGIGLEFVTRVLGD